MRGIAGGDVEVAAGERAGDDEGAGLDAVGNDAVARAVKFFDAADAQGRGARAFNVGAHFDEQRGQVRDLGLAGTVLHQGFALGEGGGHEQVFGAGDGDPVEDNVAALEALGARDHVTVLGGDGRPQTFQAFDVQIDGTRADGTSAGKGNLGHAATRHQRPEHQRGGAHGLHQLVGRFRMFQPGAGDGGAMLRAAVTELDLGAHAGEQAARGFDVAHLGNIFQHDRLVGEQGGGHGGQSGVLGAADAHRAEQGIAAANDEFVHEGCRYSV